MAFPYIDTPRTEIDGNATYLTNGFRSAGRTHLSALDSVENSFHTPSKDNDALKGFDHGRRRASGGTKLNTPRAAGSKSTRTALRHLPAAAPAKGEFTPLMKSATKNNYLKNVSIARGTDGPKTPAYMRDGYRSNGHTPGLPAMDMSDIYEEDATVDDITPVPQAVSSSAQSTPLPALPGRDGTGLLGDGQNMMTLKEQERIIDRLDKDNWNLKLKIHYLEEQLEKAGPEYNSAALKENTELKVLRLTMQRDISRYKKSLVQAERDLEDYRLQLMEMREKARRKQTDETFQREMDMLREEVESRESHVKELREELRQAKDQQSEGMDKLRDEIEDLEAMLREKDRAIEERDEKLDELRDAGNEDGAVSELQAELERAKDQVQELQDSLDHAKTEAKEATEEAQLAEREKERAEDDLRELQDEMSNKSFTTKGLSRQLEERADNLEEEVRNLRQENDSLKADVESKTESVTRLEERHQNIQQDLKGDSRKLLDDLDSIKRDRDFAQEEREKLSARLHEALNEIQHARQDKELLQTRHQTLTDESDGLQHELVRAQAKIRELQQAVEDHDGQNRWSHKEEVDRLQDEIEALQHEIEDKEGHFALEHDRWESTKRTLQSQKDRAEEQANGYKRTIEKLQEAEHTLSGKEFHLQEAIDSEKQRHTREETVLNRQIKDLEDDLASKRRIIDEQRSDLLNVKEELRISHREEQSLKEKVQALEDEVVVLQTSLADEQEYAKGRLQKGSSDVENQLHKAIADRQTLRDQLANAHVELHDLRTSVAEIETERDELHAQLDRVQNPDDSIRFDREKLDLRKSTARLESELKRLRDDKSALVQAKETLETQLGSEIERASAEEGRLSAEIDRLQDKLRTGAGDRTLALSKQRLERRVHELEALLEQQPPLADNEQSPAELSLLRHSLDDARQREKILLQREADQKTSARNFKSRIAELEKDLHGALMNKYESHSPQNSPSDKLHEELRSLRKKLSEAHRALKDIKSKNRDLERAAMKEEDQKDLHELLKSSTLEAEAMALQVSERDAHLNELKTQVRRIREERAFCVRKAESAVKELEALQIRYDEAVAKTPTSSKSRHEKEMRGLGKEIIWLRARLQREEKFRRDLAWSKGLMELGERVRVACNEADLRMITDMGVQARDRKPVRTPRRKLRTAVSLVVAAVRMKRMGQEWRRTKKLGEGLKRAKSELLKRRESSGGQLLA
ncbi:uncharacterized protein PFLUO_LOCUS4513 [Penicillium psychrofluorescens]|uniref:uncharacterized protein n=1 Tax=Penicillium psychrofluorescens TaxID=3158075 RepID=UPI003CCD083D